MFNIGFSEILLILLVAFVFVGPKDLPKVARTLGKGVKILKKMFNEFQEETGLDDVVDEFKKTSSDLKQVIKENDIKSEFTSVQKDLMEAKKDTETAINQTKETLEKELEDIKIK